MISVIIPTKVRPKQQEFLDRAIKSVREQQINIRAEIIVGADRDDLGRESSVSYALGGSSQAEAMNAAVEQAQGDYLAFLEDDDTWHSTRLIRGLEALQDADFVSSTQLEVVERNEVVRINDFATPSGWIMPRSTWEKVGPFSLDYRYHLDNEWLGRLTLSGLKRSHQVECTAPTDPKVAQQIRPWLFNVMMVSKVVRHDLPFPLVKRLVHRESNMVKLSAQPGVSGLEMKRLNEKFGTIPW